jgi:hypothetical protein
LDHVPNGFDENEACPSRLAVGLPRLAFEEAVKKEFLTLPRGGVKQNL